ncbi:type II secretion system protein [Bradyrhizobium sp. KBS0727]|uniref:PulJ/GspJ family protein n=1 Tax=unclassified Bradyrhizobium TaxID=2631580 RepID=UPI00110E9586|nr:MULTISPECIES: type II secretion system protein [unclassified Bradyrhizobium]QDW41225.1 type II secretion system protein [Bradyrhizobium sp. KBS0725]QDW47831.1 type II secretion system protein [Bradyrhizobium sp. KBS0727]
MSRATPPRIDGPDAGFTIIEVLIALAIVAVSIVAIGSVMATNVRGVKSLEQHVALIQVTRSAMTTAIPPRAELAPGASSGDLNGYRWHLDIAPLGKDWVVQDANIAWTPQLVKIHVQSPSGAAFDLQTVRLMRRPRQ